MKKFFRITGIVLLVLVVAVVSLLSYVSFALPDTGASPDLTIKATPEQIAHGEYLANHVAVCIDCHSERDWSVFAGPVLPGTEGGGGEVFDEQIGLPGSYIARNITPYNLGNWTDGEIFRAITTGVDKDDNALFPIMPYLNYGQVDKQDIYDIIAYIRTLKPIAKDIPPAHSDFPMNFIIHTIPQKADFHPRPPESDTVQYGKYLLTLASCGECHTNVDKGKPIPGMELAGGRVFPLPRGGSVTSANITPDDETGIGKWSREEFIHRFKAFADSSYVPKQVGKDEFNTLMPWTRFSGMRTEDIAAIYAYLRTVKPIHNQVTKFTE